MNASPDDFAERVYAGVLGKAIGVYLGRPVEGWHHDKIEELLGEISYYVNDRTDVPLKNHRLVVPDDDITGTLTFARALGDYAQPPGVEQVGQTWLNYIIENRTVLWWGGRGMSTEHTAFLNLKAGMRPPRTGAAATNGVVAAEQVGGQIFVEGWALACPGDAERAADLAAMAASVSHDGEALNAARVVAALVAHAFVEEDVDKLLDTAVAQIPADALIRRVIDDVREWHTGDGHWRDGLARIDSTYGYDRYPGNCHVVPNHALLINALLHGDGDFGRGLGILVSSGWDTDSNAGNLGCITGVRGGLAGLDAGPDWRSPVADRIYLPTADGGAAITDAAREAVRIVGDAARLTGAASTIPKDGARFHFAFAGSVQGFGAEPAGAAWVENRVGVDGVRGLAVGFPAGGVPARAITPTFLTPETLVVPPYGQTACPTLHSGQVLTAQVTDASSSASCALVVRVFDGADRLREIVGPVCEVVPGDTTRLQWQVPDTGGQPIGAVGLAVSGSGPAAGWILLDRLHWSGAPDVCLQRPADGGRMWRHAWVNAADHLDERGAAYRVIQDRGTGMLIQGGLDWIDYEVSADLTVWLAKSAGLAARVQGLQRYYQLRLRDRRYAELVRVLDGVTVLDRTEFEWDLAQTYHFTISVTGEQINGRVVGPHRAEAHLHATDRSSRLTGGAVALVVEEGHISSDSVRVK